MTKKSQKRGLYYRSNLTENFKTFTPPESLIFEILGQIAAIKETFSKGQKTQQQQILYPIIQGKNSKKRPVLKAQFDGKFENI